jgi:hypothetical protein
MVSPFEITEDEVKRLGEVPFVALCNRLIWVDALRARVPKDKVLISLQTKTKDEGIDADTDAGALSGEFVPPGRAVWQFKTTWKSKKSREKELRGAAIQQAFKAGAGYTFLLGEALVSKTHDGRQRTLEKEARAAGCTGPVRLFSASHIAAWASSVPSAVFELRPQIGEWLRADDILTSSKHNVPFEVDDARSAIMTNIKDTLFSDDPTTSFARIPGDAGIGKTRLALEVVKALGYERLTLYAMNPASADLFGWVAANEQVHAIVIADEVDDDESAKYEQYAEQSRGRLRLITVGRGKGSAPNVYVLPTLSNDAMERVVKSAAPALPPEQVRWVVERVGGYVKLAVAVAQCIARGQVTFEQMTTDRDFQSVITRLLGAGNQEFIDAMRVASVLTYVGWDGEAAAEGVAVTTFLGLDWPHVQLGLVKGLNDGLVVAKGRYRYVTPELLAVWFAADVWRAHAARVLELYVALPNEASRHALLDRLAHLAHIPGVQDALNQLLGPNGPFRDIDHLDSGPASRLLHSLARGSPVAAMNCLRRLLHDADHDRLLSFEGGRRYVVWTLELLLERRDTFFEAAFLVRRLAEAENENIGNNATGVWHAIFLTYLAPTEVPALERLALLRDALTSGNVRVRKLAIEALRSALQASELGLALRDGPDVPPQRWHPKTWGDVWAVKRAALQLLDRAMGDEAEDLRFTARQTFIYEARALVAQQLAPEVCERFDRIAGTSEKEKRDIWEHIMMVLKYEDALLNDDQRQTLRAAAGRIYGDSLADRIKRYTGEFSSVDWPGEGEGIEKPEVIASRLADEAMGRMDEVLAMLPWLYSGEANGIWPFAHRLGVLDESREWYETLLRAAAGQNDTRLLSGYLAGRNAAGDEAWSNRVLDELADNPETIPLAIDGTARSTPSDAALKRTLSMLDRGVLKPDGLGWMMWGHWSTGVSLPLLQRIIERLADDSSMVAVQTGLSLVNYALHRPDRTEGIVDCAWRLLENPTGWGHASMLGYYWEQVGSQVVDADPGRMTSIILRLYSEGEPEFRDSRLKLLEAALQADAAACWPKVGEVLLNEGETYRLIWSLENLELLTRIESDVVLAWVRERGADAAKAVAQIIKPGGEKLTDLTRALLAEYPEEVGPTLGMNYFTESWMGSEVAHLQGKLIEVRAWLSDDNHNVRAWVRNVIESIEARINHARQREEEDDINR